MSAWKTLTPVLIVILLMAGVSGCKTKEQEDPRTLPNFVRVATVRSAEPGARAYTGVVTARIQSDLGFRVPGKVTKRLVDAGQIVRVGDPLMRIDVTDYALVIRTQTENVEAARSKHTGPDRTDQDEQGRRSRRFSCCRFGAEASFRTEERIRNHELRRYQ